ncbi:hypothetical protein NEICINOT_03859 [Neisseria cinerea ATCC 14685]|uniref:Uncharacterized protein n=1 Tax=Neisseria cinerea ATCC 14685 TaxID=546262 RepID=D0W2H6_NEICI|nr:hypothetical protein NEICINOT_03859 [Neisseria cinerea ATCC 14685]
MYEYKEKCRLKPVSQVQTAFSMSQYRIDRGNAVSIRRNRFCR